MQRPIIKSEEFFQVKTVQIQNSTKQKLQILNPVLLIAAWARFLDRHLSNPDTSSPVQSYSLWKGSYHETAVHSLESNHHCFQTSHRHLFPAFRSTDKNSNRLHNLRSKKYEQSKSIDTVEPPHEPHPISISVKLLFQKSLHLPHLLLHLSYYNAYQDRQSLIALSKNILD